MRPTYTRTKKKKNQYKAREIEYDQVEETRKKEKKRNKKHEEE